MTKRNMKSTIKELISNNQGSILVQLIVIAALLGVLGYYIMGKTFETSQISANMNFKSDVSKATNDMYVHLANPRKCVQTFNNGAQMNPKSVVSKLDASGAAEEWKYHTKDLPEGKDGYGNTSYKINNFRLHQIAGEWYFLINYQNKNILKGRVSSDDFGQQIKMIVTWDPVTPTVMTSCRSVTDDNQIWSRDTIDINNIYYIGNVGVSDPDPNVALRVVKIEQPELLDSDEHDVDKETSLTALYDTELFGDPNEIAIRSLDTVTVIPRDLDNDPLTPDVGGKYLYDSDRKLKKSIKTIPNSIDLISKLRGVTFDWIESDGHDYGFIAQEVEKLLPEIVHTDRDGVKSVDYVKITPVLIEAFKQQQIRIQKLQKTIEQIKRK